MDKGGQNGIVEAVKSELERAKDNLDYERIHAFMTLVGWGYEEDREAPSIDRLKEMVSYLVSEAIQNFKEDMLKNEEETLPLTRIANGGFIVSVFPWREVSIVFAAEEKEYFVYFYQEGE